MPRPNASQLRVDYITAMLASGSSGVIHPHQCVCVCVCVCVYVHVCVHVCVCVCMCV